MARYRYRSCIFAILETPAGGASTRDFLAEALEEAMKVCGNNPQLMARHLVTSSFQDIEDEVVRYNAFTSAMIHLGLDVAGKLALWSQRVRQEVGGRAYYKGLADGLGAASRYVSSPYTITTLKQALRRHS